MSMRRCPRGLIRLVHGLCCAVAVLLAGCATREVVLHDVGALDPRQDRKAYIEATPEQVRRGLHVEREGKPLAVSVGMPLAVGDVVESLADILAEIHFPDGHVVTLLPDTRVRLGSAWLERGELYVLRKIDQIKALDFKVKTRYVTAGVSGTEFWVRLDREDRLAVGVVEGRVDLSSTGGLWQPVSLAPNEVANVLRDQPPRVALQPRDQVDSIVRLIGRGPRGLPMPLPRPQLPR